MPRTIASLFATLALLAGLCEPSRAELRRFDEELSQALQSLLEEKCATSTFRGVSYSIVVPGYEVWTGTYGDLGDEESMPVTKETSFGIASITKTYVAAIVLQLRDEGKLDLNDPVSKYLGQIRNIPDTVTIRHLLSMTSGLANFSSNSKGPINRAVADRTKIWTPQEILDEFLSAPVFDAGDRYMYSNTNFIVLGMIIESVTGRTFEETLRERILVPYSLNHTIMGGLQPLPDELALTDYNRNGRIESEVDDAQASISSMFWTSGGLFATSGDLVRWGAVLYGGDVLSPESLAEMVDFEGDGFGDYGLGAMPGSHIGYDFWGHGGLLSYASSLEYSPDTGIAIGFSASMDRMFGNINYWPQDDMFALLRDYGFDVPLSVTAEAIQFTDTDAVAFEIGFLPGVARENIQFEVIQGEAATGGVAVSLGKSEGVVRAKAKLVDSEFYRGESDEIEFKVYSRFGDEDGDGVENAVEALLGSDLADFRSLPTGWFLLETQSDGARLSIDPAREDIPFGLEVSDDLQNWSESALGEHWVRLASSNGSVVFARLRLR